jgi:hypothetical protein
MRNGEQDHLIQVPKQIWPSFIHQFGHHPFVVHFGDP